MKRRTIALLALCALVGVGLTWGIVHVRRNMDTYDQKYSDCMEYKKSFQPGYNFAYPSREYQAASDECGRQANQ